jgi:cold shock CspA family protein
MTENADAARFVAKLLAKRHTKLEEIPSLIETVQLALAGLGSAEIHPAKKPRLKRQPPSEKRASAKQEPKQQELEPQEALPTPTPAEPEPKTPQPVLLRRAEVISVAPAAPNSVFAPSPNGMVRGVVQWFDSRSGQGALRLPGLSHDVPVDAAILSTFGISRLFKGQEIEATLGTGDAPKILTLHLANSFSTTPVNGGTVRDRHAKRVVVELKREGLSRSAARAEAELLLRPRRAR